MFNTQLNPMQGEDWLAKANYDNWKSAFKEFASEVIVKNGVSCVLNLIVPMRLFNLVIETQLRNDEYENTVKWVVQLFKDKKIDFAWAITPFTTPKNWVEILVNNNFIELSKSPHMGIMNSEIDVVHLTKEYDNCELEIRKVTADTVDEYFIPFVEGFELTGNDVLINGFKSILRKFMQNIAENSETGLYTGYIDGKPVVTSLGYISNDVMGIYNIATTPEYRRKGYGRMMTLDLMLRGVNAGLKGSILQSSQMGKSVYEKLGFNVKFHQVNYIVKDED